MDVRFFLLVGESLQPNVFTVLNSSVNDKHQGIMLVFAKVVNIY